MRVLCGVANYFLGVDSRLRGANATTVADVPRATVAVRRLGLKMSEDYGGVVKTYGFIELRWVDEGLPSSNLT